ncbi:integrase core domain-containing protein [Herbaspirillum sp. Sphag1AN]
MKRRGCRGGTHTVIDAPCKIEEWREYYNEARPHFTLQ